MDDITVVHKNHKMNSTKVYEYNGTKYKLTAYLGGKSITKEIERLLGKKDNFMLINIMMQNNNISFKNKNQSERKKTLMQLLDLEKYEKIKKEVSSKYLEEKVKKEKLENITKNVDIISLEEESKKKEEEIKTLKDSIEKYNSNINIMLKNKEELMLNYTKINEDKMKEEPKIKKEIEKIINQNIMNESKITNLKRSITGSFEDYEITKLRNSEKYEELNKELQQKLTEKKTLYETKNKSDNIDIEINELEVNIKDIIEQEEIYVKIKEEYEEICKEYNSKKELLNNILNVLEYEKENIKIVDKKISKITNNEELIRLKESKKILIENDEIEIGKIKDELEKLERSVVQLNENIENNSDVNELYIINENKKRELQKIGDEMDSKTKLLNHLETHEYNSECEQCMKNPKVIELFNIKEEIKILNEKKELINIDKTIDERKEIYEQNKMELNKCYKNINDNGSKLKVLNENKINNEKYLVDVENKIKLIGIIERINNERNNLDIDKLMEESENINKRMQLILKKMESKKDLENKLKDLENDKILIVKNNEMKEYNEKIENEIRRIKKVMEELKDKMKEDSDNYTKIKSINEIENEKKLNIILLEKLNKELDEINIQKENIEGNKLIKNKTNELEIELKEKGKEILSLEKDLTKKEIEYNNLINNINNYRKNMGEIKDNEKIYKKWEYYNDVVDKNGIPLYIINKYLEIITKGINKIIGSIINKRIELYEMSDNVIINIYDHDNKIVDFLGGMETFILDISFKITLSKIMELSKCNFLFIDEGISSFDKDNLTNIEELFYFLNQHFDYIFLMSHIEQIKDYVSQKIIIKNEGGYSKITC
jgi:exonuclease SbcC